MIEDRHRPLLRAIGSDLLDGRVRSTDEGLEFDWHSLDGRVTTQFRPDDPDDGPKYQWPKGTVLPIGVPAGMAARVADRDRPLLFVEGTKQHLAAATYALGDPQGEAVVGLASCYGFLHDGAPTPDLLALPIAGRRVLICMDADVATNRDVHDAAERLAQFCDVEGGAASIEFVLLPGTKDGMDDILGRAADPAATYRRLLARAVSRLPKKPPPPARAGYFDRSGKFLVAQCYNDIVRRHHLAVTEENTVAVYQGGLYHNGQSKFFNRIVLNMLGDDFRKVHLDNVTEMAVTMCRSEGVDIPERPERLLINVRNGLLDPVTLTLHPHDPRHRVLFQFDVEWDPDATCPTFDRWVEDVLPGRVGELLDAVAPMLDPLRTPTKAVFLYGPSRSGKSTYGRLVKAMVGSGATASVTLQQLSDDKFAAANLYGKVLNLAMDLSSRDVKDLSTFKMMTGEDPIQGNRKYGQQFSFTNQALIVFSANEVPAVAETSKAWMSRVSPFKFPNSFIGAEDPSIEEAMMAELPGIFRRHILALQAQLARGGGYMPVTHDDVAEFQRKTNRVEEYLFDRTRRVERPDGTERARVQADYRMWCEANGYLPMGRNHFFAALRTAGVDEFKPAGGVWTFALVIEDPERRDEDGEDGPTSAVLGSFGRSEEEPRTSTLATNTPQSEIPSVQGCSETAETGEPLALDLETLDAGLLFAGRRDFIRVACTPAGRVDPASLTGTLVAHNGFGFDFHALGLDVVAEGDAGRLIDTMVLGMLDHPPLGRRAGREALKGYSLDAMADRYGIPGKSADIKSLEKKYGGFDRIPLEVLEPYCTQDATVAAALLDRIGLDDYSRREMRVMGRLAGSITGTGFAVDEALLAQRIEEGEARREAFKATLVERYGMPTGGKAPQATRAGKEAIARAFADLGVVLPTTASGGPALGKDALGALDLEGDAADLRDAVLGLNGVRSVYGTIAQFTVAGRVHPSVVPVQASGRFSIWDPGLTVMGKRDGKHVERDVLVADEGCLLVAFDLNQIDARAVAVHSQDPDYLKLFVPGVDSHTEVAMALWGDPRMREQAKAIAHAWNYGSGIRNIVAHTGLPEETVRQFDSGMRERFPRLVEWRREVYEQGAAGVMLDNGFGRRLKVDPKFAYTQAPAYMGQSTARDLMCEGVLRLPLDVVRMIRAFVHDEIILSIPEDSLDEVTRTVLDALTFRWAPPGLDLDVEITADSSKAAKSWGSCYRKGK